MNTLTDEQRLALQEERNRVRPRRASAKWESLPATIVAYWTLLYALDSEWMVRGE